MTWPFKPWEIPTYAKPTPESVTAAIDSDELRSAKIVGFALHQSPFDDATNIGDPNQRWYLHRRVLDDGRILTLEPMLGGILSLGVADGPERWHNIDRYCYDDHDAGWRAVLGWNGKGDPEGWHRHPRSGRRRPDRTIESEYWNKDDAPPWARLKAGFR
jgi:hypothetical protein